MAGFSPLESGSTAPKSNIAIDHKRVLPLNSSLRSQEYQALGDSIVFLGRMRSCEVHPLEYSRITCHRLTDLADQQIHFPRPWNRPKQTLPFNYALITLDFYSKMYPRHIYDFFRAVETGLRSRSRVAHVQASHVQTTHSQIRRSSIRASIKEPPIFGIVVS